MNNELKAIILGYTAAILLIAGLLTMCIPPNHAFYTVYTVKAGSHYNLPKPGVPIPTNLARWSFKTNDTWIWEQSNDGYSKIGGIYWGSDSHVNSVRLAVRNYKGNIECAYYIYEHQIAPMQNHNNWGFIMNLEVNKEYNVVTGWKSGEFLVSLQDTIIEIPTSWKPDWPALFAGNYIGGTYTIDHDWKVPIKFNTH